MTVDATPPRLRPVTDEDFEALTALLHRAYAPLAARGLHYVATHQSVDVTRKRAREGECWVATAGEQLVGTVTLVPPRSSQGRTRGCGWYDRPDVARFGQLGVEPAFKGTGVGRLLLGHIEARARALDAAELACDTSEHATDLVALYERRGYRLVDRADWRPHVNYRSVVLSLRLR